MPKIQRSHVKSLNRYLPSRDFDQHNPPPISIEKFPPLQEGCWYVGKVVKVDPRGKLVVHQSPNNPVVILKGCEDDVKKGQKVIYEVTEIHFNHILGDFKELY